MMNIETALGCCAYENGENTMRDGGYSGDREAAWIEESKVKNNNRESKVSEVNFGMPFTSPRHDQMLRLMHGA
jgi:hypothetical protein